MTEQQNIFSVQFLNIDKYRFPKEHRLHLILILKGEVILSIDGGITYTMREGHTQIINSNYGWSVSGDNDNILIIISISPVIMFNQPTGIEQTTFEINCKQFPFETEEIAIRIKNIALLWIKKIVKLGGWILLFFYLRFLEYYTINLKHNILLNTLMK